MELVFTAAEGLRVGFGVGICWCGEKLSFHARNTPRMSNGDGADEDACEAVDKQLGELCAPTVPLQPHTGTRYSVRRATLKTMVHDVSGITELMGTAEGIHSEVHSLTEEVEAVMEREMENGNHEAAESLEYVVSQLHEVRSFLFNLSEY
jgi:hypothetical protein